MTKYVLAPDSFKESMIAKEVCEAMSKGIKKADPTADIISVPMADGFKTNCAYFKLGFLDKTAVKIGRQFREILPMLWMKAG